jgi:hypothetical protein
MQAMIAEFETLVPPRSLLGRELKALLKERDKQEALFDLAIDKMDYETSPLRRANCAIERFIDNWLPRVQSALVRVEAESLVRFNARQDSVLMWEYGTPTPVDRRSEATIWARHALDRFREVRPAMRRAKMYHPHVLVELLSAWKVFRHELRLWKYARVPFDGSQAMASMLQFFMRLDLLGAVND